MKEENCLRNELKAIRTRLGISQQDLAKAAGIARQTIGGIESELYAPSAMVALRLAKALGCSMEELFWLDGVDSVLEAAPATGMQPELSQRLTLAHIDGRWVAHPLQGDAAFRSEMIPADGVGTWKHADATMSVTLLDEPEALARTVVIAGCTPALSLWARSAERWFPGLRVQWMHANSMDALQRLSNGEVHMAGIHLYDQETGEYNAPFVRRILPDRATVLVNLGVWNEGFVVQAGNPKSLHSAADLTQEGVQLINREKGSGSRMLLESLIESVGVSTTRIAGYGNTLGSHQDIALEIAAGKADVGVSTESISITYGLGFVPLRKVRYDLVLMEEYLQHEPVKQLLSTLQHRWVRSQLSVLGGYDMSMSGDRTYIESQMQKMEMQKQK